MVVDIKKVNLLVLLNANTRSKNSIASEEQDMLNWMFLDRSIEFVKLKEVIKIILAMALQNKHN